jgi:uncharacterized membrane protein YgaE (UPF0421/DUF939 family)
VLLAAKTALACGLAWYLAPWVPFAENDYSYYAPLGALVSMYPTLMSSLRTGVQTLAGVAVGVCIGIVGVGAVSTGTPPIVALVGVVGMGILAGVVRPLGAGRDWVPMAAIFMLLIGGTNADEFSVSYLATLAFGVAVGLCVNLAIVPPLYLRHAERRISQLRDTAARCLHDIADLVSDRESGGDIDRMMTVLRETATAVAADVHDAEESARGNPRSGRHGAERRSNDRRQRALERSVFSIRDLADALFSDDDGDRRSTAVPQAAQAPLAKAIHACGDLTGSSIGEDRAPALLAEADRALDSYLAALEDPPPNSNASMAVAFCLQRIIGNARPFV